MCSVHCALRPVYSRQGHAESPAALPGIFDEETRQRIREHVARADSDYFARHPGTVARLRFAIPEEFPGYRPRPGDRMLIVQLTAFEHYRAPVSAAAARVALGRKAA